MPPSILWYDLETFGLDPRHDRIAQFAAIRTTEDLKPMGEPVSILCKPSLDYLPSPYSCMVHRISPRTAMDRGLIEYDFARRILALMSESATCVAGYNSIRFDDEFIRNLLYRNLLDPYEREWADGNSRWDVIDLMRAARDLRPEGMSWPVNDEGKPEFTLGSLAAANGIPLETAHDAAFDIQATILLAALVREKQPKLYDWYWRHRSRESLRPLIDLSGHSPLLHTAAAYTRPQGCTTILAPVGMIPGKRDGLLAVDLRHDIEPLLDLEPEEIRRRAFSPGNRLDPGERLPLVSVRLGRCPYLAPLSILDAKAASRLELDPAQAQAKAARLAGNPQLIQKLAAAHSWPNPPPEASDPDYRIYSGGFFKDEDRDAMAAVHESIDALGPKEARPQAYALRFQDGRLPQMARRLFARNWPDTLSRAEADRWRSFCAARLLCPRIEGATDLAAYAKIVDALMAREDTKASDKPLLAELMAYKAWLEAEVLSYRDGLAPSPRPD